MNLIKRVWKFLHDHEFKLNCRVCKSAGGSLNIDATNLAPPIFMEYKKWSKTQQKFPYDKI